MKKTWKDTQALVTGAASGIGLATALELARRGARVALVDLDPAKLAQAKRAVQAAGGTGSLSSSMVSTHVLDVADAEAVAEFGRKFTVDFAPLDLLVNNAGVSVVAPFTATREADWQWLMGVNVWGPLRLTRALLPSMLARGAGDLAFVASLAGLVGAPGMVAYSTSKFAIVGFAEALRLELAGTGVGVTVVCPGYVRTGLHAATRYRNEGFRRFLDNPPSWYGISKERVARELLDAVAQRRPLVTLGPESMGYWLKRLAPSAAFTLTRWAAKATGTAHEPSDAAR
jgi:NAD(P)-dependent dehydrogenase (short-subunit alcohol dehydrogenase family)